MKNMLIVKCADYSEELHQTMIIHLQRIDFYEYLFGQLFSNVYLSSHFTIDLIQSKAHIFVRETTRSMFT